jgi:hypothetical protein
VLADLFGDLWSFLLECSVPRGEVAAVRCQRLSLAPSVGLDALGPQPEQPHSAQPLLEPRDTCVASPGLEYREKRALRVHGELAAGSLAVAITEELDLALCLTIEQITLRHEPFIVNDGLASFVQELQGVGVARAVRRLNVQLDALHGTFVPACPRGCAEQILDGRTTRSMECLQRLKHIEHRRFASAVGANDDRDPFGPQLEVREASDVVHVQTFEHGVAPFGFDGE